MSSGSSFMPASISTLFHVPHETRAPISSGEAVGIAVIGPQNNQHQDSEEGKKDLDLHHF